MSINEIINMIAVRDSFVAAIGSMDMILIVASDFVIAGAPVRMHGINLNNVCGNSLTLLVLQMAALQIIRVTVVFDGGMAATRAVLMLFGIFHRAFRSLN